MDFNSNSVDDGFRAEVREFLELSWSSTVAAGKVQPRGREAFAMAAKILAPKKWLAPSWPIEWGGANLPPIQRYILEQELAAARFLPRDRMALDLAGPVIHTFGSPEQKQRHLPRILKGEEVWCQGFSEPEAGSDVNSLRTTATWNGTHYVVEGHKIWTTNAHFADMMFALVRIKSNTGVQAGITIMLIDMHHKDVQVRPIRTLDRRHHINEVVLEKVIVPPSCIVGERGRGWSNARFLLANERILLAQVPQTRQTLERVKHRLAAQERSTGYFRNDIGLRYSLAQAEIELLALEFSVLRALHAIDRGPLTEGLVSALKLRGAELKQRTGELEVEVMGNRGLILDATPTAGDGDAQLFDDLDSLAVRNYLFDRTATIAGGTSEVQRNVIAAIALGL